MAPGLAGPHGLTKRAGFWHSHAIPPTPPLLTHVCVYLHVCMSLHALIEFVQDAKQKG